MAWEPGGISEKLGNRYEGRWVVQQLLRLLAEQIRSVGVELIGDDERGVDLWVRRNDGIREAQQCKGRNQGRHHWSLADLERRGVLGYMRDQLDRDPNHEFALVSAVPATNLADICESARHPGADSEQFYRHQIEAISRERRDTFQEFCKRTGLDARSERGRRSAFDLLRRAHFYTFNDDQNARDDLRAWATMLVAGGPDTVIAVLADFAQERIRTEICADDLRKCLASQEFHPRDLAHDTRVAPAIEGLQREFDESIRPKLIGRKLIPREESGQILKALSDNAVVVVHGRAGHGKSAVLFELTKRLAAEGIPFLPIRLDRRHPENTARQFGQQIGLPESPVPCLAAVAESRQSVLILDQLDALRWTGAHSANALDVCKAIIREVMTSRGLGKRVCAVVCSRTFDLEHDPEISNWLGGKGQHSVARVEVKPLSEPVVREIVGVAYEQLGVRQREVLQSAHCLAIWAQLAEGGTLPNFRSATDLMREYWNDRRRELVKCGISAEAANSTLDTLVEYMEDNPRLYAPETLVANRLVVSDALQSLGIIQIAGRQVTFSHQSLFDFLVAEHLLRQIHQGEGSVVAWLDGKQNQSLFRREQLRQVLSLLSDECPEDFLRNVRDVLSGPDVRFHLKHLVLEILGQLDAPPPALLDYLFALIGDQYWKPHVLETVFGRHEQFVRAMVDRGILRDWLDSPDQGNINWSLGLLRSVNESCGDIVATMVEPLITRGDQWPQWILNVLPFGPETDSAGLFELRLKLACMGFVHEFVNWPKLAEAHPRRVIQLVEAVVSSWDTATEDEDAPLPRRRSNRGRMEQWTTDDLKAIKAAAGHSPEHAWDSLMPHLERLTAVDFDRYDATFREWQDTDPFVEGSPTISIRGGLVAVLCEAGKAMAEHRPEELLSRTRPLHESVSVITQQILLDAYAHLPERHADEALQWLLGDTRRFAIGPGDGELKWMPAATVIEGLSPHCSDKVFGELEDKIARYHSPDERRDAEYWVGSWRTNYYGDWFGRAQHFLLPALCPLRRCATTEGLIGVLERRFARYADERFLRSGRSAGGFVSSPLHAERLLQISDKAWLRIIQSKRIAKERHGCRRQVAANHVAESSVEMFSHDLARAAQRQPERFARLALRFPADVHREYLDAILRGVAPTKPQEVPENEKPSWEPARHETIEALLARTLLEKEEYVASAFCWLIRERADEDWSDTALRRLVEYASTHPDPAPGKLNVRLGDRGDDCDKASEDTLWQNTINCVRGAAAHAIAALLWDHPDWLPRLEGGIERLVVDRHPAVRVAAVEVCLPVLNIDKDVAIKWFCIACKDDLRIAACHSAVRLFNCAIQSHYEHLAPIILAMCESDRDEVAEEGAEEVAARWLFYEMFANELDECKRGRLPLRKGVAKVAAHLLDDERYSDRCQELLLSLFNDPESTVRKQAALALATDKPLSQPRMPEFVAKFIKSPAFADDPTGLLRALSDYPQSLLPFSEAICATGELLAEVASDRSRQPTPDIAHDVWYVSPLLLRLYEHAQDGQARDVQNRCLDTWDILFEKQLGGARELTKAIDK